MPTTLRMSCNPAIRKPSGIVAESYDLTGKVPAIVPVHEVEIRTAADAEKAFGGYVERVKATGQGAIAHAFLGGDGRAPRGFRKLTLRAECSLEPEGA